MSSVGSQGLNINDYCFGERCRPMPCLLISSNCLDSVWPDLPLIFPTCLLLCAAVRVVLDC